MSSTATWKPTLPGWDDATYDGNWEDQKTDKMRNVPLKFSIQLMMMMMMTGWWYTYPSETYEFVSWDYDIPNLWKIKKKHVPNHQPVM